MNQREFKRAVARTYDEPDMTLILMKEGREMVIPSLVLVACDNFESKEE